MAMLYKNICRFGQCNLEFANLYDLIQHIEETHIPADSEKKPETQQQVACGPLSSICRYFQKLPDQPARPVPPEPVFQQPSPNVPSAAQAAAAMATAAAAATAKKRVPAIIGQSSTSPSVTGGLNSFIPGVQGGSQTSLGTSSILFHPPANPSRNSGATPASHVSEGDDESMSVGRESVSSESSMNVDDNMSDTNFFCKIISPNGNEERRFVCTFPGCKKSYKNMNGIRYHVKIAHANAVAAAEIQQNAKNFKCQCGKAYKTHHGLHNHMLQTGHRQATQMTLYQHSPPIAMAGGTAGGGGLKHSTALSGMSHKASQAKRSLQLSLMGASGNNAAGPAGQKQMSQGQSATVGNMAYYSQQSGVKSFGGGASGGNTATLPSGVSVQVSNLGGGTPTTVQVGQQGALGVSVSSIGSGQATMSSQGPSYRPGEGRRLTTSTAHHGPQMHSQQQLHSRPLKIHSAGSSNLGQGMSSMTSHGGTAVTTMGGRSGQSDS